MLSSRPERGVLDTSVFIAIDEIVDDALPRESALSAITLAELNAGPHMAANPIERSHRQARVQLVEATIEILPFDASCARAYGWVCASVTSAGRKPRGRRAVDLFIAATALAHGLPLYTCNPDDFAGIDGLTVMVVPLPERRAET